MKYRSEIPFGEGYRNAAEVMAHEIFTLQNTDIIDTLLNSDLISDRHLRDKMADYAFQMESNYYVEDEKGLPIHAETGGVVFCQEILNEISAVTGKDIRYALWLAEKDAVINYYGRGKLCEEDVDAYEESDIVLSNCGFDGCLYGYEEMPLPIEKELERE